MWERFKQYLKDLYQEIIHSQDSPQKISLSVALGVFLGIMPFTGVIAAVAAAIYFKLNKAGALIGSMITNTWLGFAVLAMSIQVSCLFLSLTPAIIQEKFQAIFTNFHWDHLKDIFLLKIAIAVSISYFLLTILITLLSYLICLVFFSLRKPAR